MNLGHVNLGHMVQPTGAGAWHQGAAYKKAIAGVEHPTSHSKVTHAYPYLLTCNRGAKTPAPCLRYIHECHSPASLDWRGCHHVTATAFRCCKHLMRAGCLLGLQGKEKQLLLKPDSKQAARGHECLLLYQQSDMLIKSARGQAERPL